MDFSPSPNEFDDLFANDSISIDGDEVNLINPDDFLNLNEFKAESPSSSSSFDMTFANHSPQQLTPPISPQPINNNSVIISSSNYQRIRIIPITVLQQQQLKRKVKPIVPKPSSSSDSDSNTGRKSSLSPVDKNLIKQQRLIKNRESATISRNKKKEYVQSMEKENLELRKENLVLKAENSLLKERLKGYGAMTCRCSSSITTRLPSRNATVMLAVLFMVGFNIVPFGNFILKTQTKNPMAVQQFNSRHLLFTVNTSSATNESSSDFVEPDAPLYFNQTDHIRKVNIDNIRRWIPEPDLFNVSNVKTEYEVFNPDPLQEKLTKMYEKSREQSQKGSSAKSKKRIPKKKPTIGPMQLYNANLNIIKLNEFFDEINRKDDTFYVFSFKADHLLLPAIDNSYNFSQIKMNLIMPRSNSKFSVRQQIHNTSQFERLGGGRRWGGGRDLTNNVTQYENAPHF